MPGHYCLVIARELLILYLLLSRTKIIIIYFFKISVKLYYCLMSWMMMFLIKGILILGNMLLIKDPNIFGVDLLNAAGLQ